MNKYFKGLLIRQKLGLLFVYLGIFMLATVIGNAWMTRDQYSGQIPSFTAKDLQGSNVSLKFNQHGAKPVVIYFFAEWCPICKIQHPVISSLDEEFEVLGIAMQSGDDEQVKKYITQQGLEFTVINDETGRLSSSFGVNGVPAAFIADATGKINYSTRGYATEAGLRSRLWLAQKTN